MTNLAKASFWLESAAHKARHATKQTRSRVIVALAKLHALAAIQKASR